MVPSQRPITLPQGAGHSLVCESVPVRSVGVGRQPMQQWCDEMKRAGVVLCASGMPLLQAWGCRAQPVDDTCHARQPHASTPTLPMQACTNGVPIEVTGWMAHHCPAENTPAQSQISGFKLISERLCTQTGSSCTLIWQLRQQGGEPQRVIACKKGKVEVAAVNIAEKAA